MSDTKIPVEVEIRVTDSSNRTVSKHFEFRGGTSVEDAANRLRRGFTGTIDKDSSPISDED